MPTAATDIAERIKDHLARNVADWVMYRQALAEAAERRGWAVHWYDAKRVLDGVSEVLGVDNLEAHFSQLRRDVGPPWGRDHKLAMAAAIAERGRQ